MADAAARREARRRKILENSENRLKKINGLHNVAGDTLSQELMDPSISQPLLREDSGSNPISESISTAKNNFRDASSERPDPTSHHINHEGYMVDPIFTTMESNAYSDNAQHTTDRAQSLTAILISAKLHIVGLALIVRLLLSFNFGFLFGESIFVPFGTLQLVKYLQTSYESSETVPSSGLLSAALMFSGIAPQRISLLFKILGFAKDCLQDFYIYFFSFIILHVLLDSFT